jgi:hypothetical protein
MTNAARWTIQLLAYLTFAVLLGYLSASPAYDCASTDRATIKLSLSHATERAKPCVRLTPEQIAELAENMRRVEQCERERLPMIVELEIDGVLVARIEAPPSGLWGDGPASVYERIEVPPGEHTILARMRDSKRDEGWDYVDSRQVMLQPGRYFTITFQAATGGFAFR